MGVIGSGEFGTAFDAAQCHPLRKAAVIWGRARKLASLTGPTATKAKRVSPVAGRARTPAFTSEDWMVPLARTVDTATRPCSPLDSDAAS